MLLSPNIKEGHKPKTVQAFCRFPWEEPVEEEVRKKAEQYRITETEIAELNRIFEQIAQKKE